LLLTAARDGRQSLPRVGIGGFDDWAYYAAPPSRPRWTTRAMARNRGATTSPRSAPDSTGARPSPYFVTTIIFVFNRRLLAMLFLAELAQPGTSPSPSTRNFNVLLSDHAAWMIFLFRHPAFAGLGNYGSR